MRKEIKKAPTIRFRGFTDDWEQHKVSDIAGRYDNLRVPVSSNKRVHGTTPYYGANGVQDYVDGYTHDGEYILIAVDGANDLQNYPVHYVNGRIWVNNHAHVLQGKTGIADTKFLSYAFSQIDISSLLVGGGRAKLNADVLMKLDLLLPEHKEQEKLGNYFSHIDSLIPLHQRKLDQLKKLKKYFLQNMFPAKGEKVPRIRFKGFTGDWEQRKLGEMAESFQYGLNAAAKKYDGKNKYIRITDIDDLSHEFLQSNLTSPDTDISQADNYRLNEGNILFARTGASVGKTYIYKHSDGRVYYAGFLIRAKLFKEYAPEFIFQNTLTSKYKRFIQITSQRSGQPGVNAQEYADYGLMAQTSHT